MFRPIVLALLLCASLPPVSAVAMEPAAACLAAAAAAQRKWALPPDLVGAIGRVESGRFDRLTNRVSPWPWTVNANGTGSYFATQAEAVAFVQMLQARGVRTIDVGCFQVDLFFHPNAFANLQQAFDPDSNADYVARFLTALHNQTGDWSAAVARYHSVMPVEGESYRRRVMAAWRSGDLVGGMIGGAIALSTQPKFAVRGPQPDRFVVLMSDEARAIKVFRPSISTKN